MTPKKRHVKSEENLVARFNISYLWVIKIQSKNIVRSTRSGIKGWQKRSGK